jgi:hypothetical protein
MPLLGALGVGESVASFNQWIVKLNENETPVSDKDLDLFIVKAELLAQGRLWIGKDGGPRPWWHRMFGAQRWTDSIFAIEWHNDAAALIFHDDNWSEYRALRPKELAPYSEDVRLKIAHGESSPALEDECISKELAFKAIKEALKYGQRPTWLNYRFVE